MALVKGRVVAADKGFHSRLQNTVESCAYYRSFSGAELEHADEIRRRLAEQADTNDIKKGEGGSMEFEFALRLLQIQDGRAELRKREALEALDALSSAGLIREEEKADLHEAYIALRGGVAVDRSARKWDVPIDIKAPCEAHDSANLRCAIYDRRPRVCRDFPWNPDQVVGTPCSYWFVRQVAGREEVVAGGGAPEEIRGRSAPPPTNGGRT